MFDRLLWFRARSLWFKAIALVQSDRQASPWRRFPGLIGCLSSTVCGQQKSRIRDKRRETRRVAHRASRVARNASRVTRRATPDAQRASRIVAFLGDRWNHQRWRRRRRNVTAAAPDFDGRRTTGRRRQTSNDGRRTTDKAVFLRLLRVPFTRARVQCMKNFSTDRGGLPPP